MWIVLLAALAACAPSPSGSAAGSAVAVAAPSAPPAGEGVPDPVATVDGEAISAASLEDKAAAGLQAARQQMYDARRSALEELIVEKMLEKEAAARGTDKDKLLADEVDAKAPPPDDAAIQAFFNENAAKMGGQPYEAMKPRIAAFMGGQAKNERMGAFIGELKAKYKVQDNLEPPRIAVEAGDSARKGSASAPIQIIEFSDFECPYCTRGADTINQVVAKYGDKVSVVYKHFPLSFHARARPAAEASECAREGGKFWEYHDQLFANQSALGDDDLKKYAKAVGLDVKKFETCLSSHAMGSRVDADMALGAKVGMSGTPGFYINGVNLPGAVPLEAFAQVIDKELSRLGQ